MLSVYLFRNKKLSAKSIFKYQNRILQSQHVFAQLVAKRITSQKPVSVKTKIISITCW